MATTAAASTAAVPPAAPAPEATATDTAAASAPARKTDAPTILTTLHTLLRAHCQAHPSPTLPYLHPYAPLPSAPWKGKARAELPSADAQADMLRAMRDVVDGARGVLGRRDESDRVRLARAMREVITHESALLPLGTTLASLPPCAPTLDAVVPLPPSELLPALGKRLGLQVFVEDSQFGLLRKSLTLAGSRFVVDVDLEMDAAEGDQTEPPSMAGTPAGAGNGFSGMAITPIALGSTPVPSASKVPSDRDRGKVRLAKLTASHVTPTGDAGKSDWVARVLRHLVEEHLACWNARGTASASKEASYRACAALENALGELKALDDLAEAASATDADLFLDLETLAAGVTSATESDGQGRIYIDPRAGMYPSFRLLPGEPGRSNPAFRFRPVGKGEVVPPPPDEDANAIAADGETLERMCRGAWLVEFVDNNPTPSAGGRGLVVRRTWLLPDGGPDSDAAVSLNNGIKAEGLLYQAALEETSAGALPLFPYASVFSHKREGGMDQYWSLASPGPDGYVVGRIGLPASWKDFSRLAAALRAQLVLNALFSSAFEPTAADAGDSTGANGAGNGTEDDAMDLLDLESAPTALPLTATLQARGLRVTFPYPSTSAEPPTIALELRATALPPYIAASWDAEPALSEDEKAKMDAAVTAALGGADASGAKGDVEMDGAGGAEAGGSTGNVDAVELVGRVLAAL